ncbi:MAG: NfeD family protein [Burkholderiaceae bacterium]|nr:NfeD family protein [Burkholderiaceae bacterium]
MDASTLWWLLAGAVVGIELLTGTFYLLMLALGPVVGAVSAYAGLPVNGQIMAAALVGAGAVAACHQWRKKRLGDASVGADRSVNLDIGETVQIDHWNSDGTAFVRYRGAQWTAIHRPGTTPRTGLHRVAELVGSRLLVDPA